MEKGGDDWLANDKLQHLLLCFSVAIIFCFLASRAPCSLVRRHSIPVGCVISLSAGAAKEIADELGFFNSAGASAKDAVADVLGVFVAVIAIYIWKSLYRTTPRQLDQNKQGFEIV
uniref:uncharacterized protein LOC122589998 n=1 Tax=Erigeron canadensis TaxID=72917 RepID=UPI001CB8F4B0|nr:uncharacterized protein LOC122589998 [Erigeron canadensis]XP_043618266.1 uncharacterized protein LOC122589998 [Erigeron canadensis]